MWKPWLVVSVVITGMLSGTRTVAAAEQDDEITTSDGGGGLGRVASAPEEQEV